MTEPLPPRPRASARAHLHVPPRPTWYIHHGPEPIAVVDVLDGLVIQSADPQHLLDLAGALTRAAEKLRVERTLKASKDSARHATDPKPASARLRPGDRVTVSGDPTGEVGTVRTVSDSASVASVQWADRTVSTYSVDRLSPNHAATAEVTA